MHAAPHPLLLPLPDAEQGRADFYALIGALLLNPAPALVQALSRAPALAAGGTGMLASAWQAMVDAARACGADTVRDEHAALFEAVGQPLVDPYASRYLGGALMDAPLARLRADLRALGLARRHGAAHTEDHLGALCETMRLLVTGAAGLPPQALAVQQHFFAAHLAPWAGSCLQDIRQTPGVPFHAALATLAQAFFDTERDAFALDHPTEPAHADDHHHAHA